MDAGRRRGLSARVSYDFEVQRLGSLSCPSAAEAAAAAARASAWVVFAINSATFSVSNPNLKELVLRHSRGWPRRRRCSRWVKSRDYLAGSDPSSRRLERT